MPILSALAAGAGAGLVGKGIDAIFGDDDGGGKRSPAAKQRQRILDNLLRQYREAQDQDPTESATFQTSVSQLQEQVDEQAEDDAAAAAARGLEGSQFEVAQDAVRARTLARGTQDALSRAEQAQDRRQSQRLGTLMSGLSAQDTNFWRRREMDARRRRQILGSLGNALRTGAYAYANRGSGGSAGGGG